MVQAEKLRAEFALRLNKAIAQAGWPDHGKGARLAKTTHTTPKAASKWLNGESIPRRDKIEEIAKALDVSTLWLEFGEHVENAYLEKGRKLGLELRESSHRYTSNTDVAEESLNNIVRMLKHAQSNGVLTDQSLLGIEAMIRSVIDAHQRR